jgi:Ohr subfamily peroxiredoxin
MITPIEKVLYTARVHTTGGREGGACRSDDGHLDVKTTPPGRGDGTNPEQLLAAGWSTCYTSAMKIVAGQMKVRFPAEAAVDAEIDLGTGGGGYLLQARFNISLPGLEREVAQAIVDAAHKQCPYSKALHDSVDLKTNLV